MKTSSMLLCTVVADQDLGAGATGKKMFLALALKK